MGAVPFVLRRPWLLVRDILTNRDRPDLERLRRVREPDRFVWEILPHAARTFSACIAMLPTRAAKPAAVGYLYCRILDTYEDLHPEPVEALRAFASRLTDAHPAPPPPIPDVRAGDARDRGHLLLVERCEMVDRVFERLDARSRSIIADLVRSMADGMCWSAETFARQNGVLRDEHQLARYCRNVLGFPVVFTLRLLRGRDLDDALHEDAMAVGEMIQVANITRDIEKDLRRGVAYHPTLRPGADVGTIRAAREDLLRFALRRAPAYRRMVAGMEPGRFSLARASAVLMLLFTSRYFRKCARRCGLRGWRGSVNMLSLFVEMLPAIWSPAWADERMARIERDFLRAARG